MPAPWTDFPGPLLQVFLPEAVPEDTDLAIPADGPGLEEELARELEAMMDDDEPDASDLGAQLDDSAQEQK